MLTYVMHNYVMWHTLALPLMLSVTTTIALALKLDIEVCAIFCSRLAL